MRNLQITAAGMLRVLADRLDPPRAASQLGWFWDGQRYVYRSPTVATYTGGTGNVNIRWIGGSS